MGTGLFVTLIIVGTIVYIGLGVAVSFASLTVWDHGEEGILSFILYPANTVTGNVGSDSGLPTVASLVLDNDEWYVIFPYFAVNSLIWPLRLAYNLLSLPVIGIVALAIFLIDKISDRRRTAKERRADKEYKEQLDQAERDRAERRTREEEEKQQSLEPQYGDSYEVLIGKREKLGELVRIQLQLLKRIDQAIADKRHLSDEFLDEEKEPGNPCLPGGCVVPEWVQKVAAEKR